MKKWLIRLGSFFNRPRLVIVKNSKVGLKKTVRFVDRKPLLSFFILLGLILVLIIVSNLLPKPQIQVVETDRTKTVQTYFIGQAPRLSVQAQIKKTGVIQINALTGGVVNKIHKNEGDSLKSGDLLISMSANYRGANASSVARQIAQTQYKNINDTYPLQKDIINKQKEMAGKTDENSDQMREIQNRSLDETRSLISLNETIIKTIDEDLAGLETNPVVNRAAILLARQLRSQFASATNQARNSLRTAEFESASDKPPAQLSDLSREVTLKQLEVQEKQLDLNKEVTRLQLAVAQINESLYFPSSPFKGVVERVLVKPFQNVTPGTPLMVISQSAEADPVTAIAFVSKEVAEKISYFEASTIRYGNNLAYDTLPSYVSTEAVQGSLYAIYFPIPEQINKEFTSDGFITVEIPIGYPDTISSVPFVPLDAIYQTRDKAYIFIVEDQKAKSREVTLGQVYGRYSEITSGLKGGEEIILDRNVLDGDPIRKR